MSGPDAAFLAGPESGFFALTEAGDLIGFRSFGADGQVPGGAYDSSALDTGGGLRPDLTGRGLGREAIATGLAFGRERFAPAAFRVTVASFNLRALRVVEALGFRRVDRFRATTSGRSYEILTRPEVAGGGETPG
jgi:[ribosomal protein S18]-alanine N-acetyltransferase